MRILCISSRYYTKNPATGQWLNRLFTKGMTYDLDAMELKPHNAFLNKYFRTEDGRGTLDLPETDWTPPPSGQRRHQVCPQCGGKGRILCGPGPTPEKKAELLATAKSKREEKHGDAGVSRSL